MGTAKNTINFRENGGDDGNENLKCLKMHVRNPYRNNAPDFGALALKYDDFRLHCIRGTDGKFHVNFRDSNAVRMLAKTLLLNDFELDVELPSDCLVPRVPQRLNYILCIEDILSNNGFSNDILGIDIGTGASCIYPLLGAKHCCWRFIATEVDDLSARVASDNVRRNNLESKIHVVHVHEDQLIKDVVQSLDENVMFCMCNPPFYEYDEFEEKYECLSDGVMKNSYISGRVNRPAPRSTTIAKSHEIAVEGGEVAFVSRLIEESILLQDRVKIYTSMVGKKSSLTELKKKLRRCLNARISTHTLCQGKTQRWVIAWTFDSKVQLKTSEKAIVPLDLSLPQTFPKKGILAWVKKSLKALEITYECVGEDILICEAMRNSWSQQRQKRRAELCTAKAPRSKILRSSSHNVGCSAIFGASDGRDSLTDAGNFSSCTITKALRQDTFNAAIQAYFPSNNNIGPLVRFRLAISQAASSIKFHFSDGSRNAMHQIWQYYRNQLTREQNCGM